MAIITRTAKGSKLTIAEMDGNLTTLQSSSFQDGVYQLVSENNGTTSTIAVNEFGSISMTNYKASTGEIIVESPLFSPTTFETDVIVAGTYTEIAVGTDGNGINCLVDVEVSELLEITSVTVVDPGSGYVAGDEISINSTDLGAERGGTEKTSYTLQSRDLSPELNSSLTLNNKGQILLTGYLTADPGVAGALWVDGGADYVVKVSQG